MVRNQANCSLKSDVEEISLCPCLFMNITNPFTCFTVLLPSAPNLFMKKWTNKTITAYKVLTYVGLQNLQKLAKVEQTMYFLQ